MFFVYLLCGGPLSLRLTFSIIEVMMGEEGGGVKVRYIMQRAASGGACARIYTTAGCAYGFSFYLIRVNRVKINESRCDEKIRTIKKADGCKLRYIERRASEGAVMAEGREREKKNVGLELGDIGRFSEKGKSRGEEEQEVRAFSCIHPTDIRVYILNLRRGEKVLPGKVCVSGGSAAASSQAHAGCV